MFQEIGGGRRQPSLEETALARWKEGRLFARAQQRRAGAPRFTFYEGPPTANGRPGVHHVLSRTFKDAICRYRDLTGFLVERKAGWDTHGLPVEVEVEKQLKIHGKADIVAFGVEKFTQRCIESVFKYTSDWERMTDRIGYWLDLESAYVTYHEPYVESVWWALKSLFDRGLLYKGYKVVWWWPQGGTALSSAEVGLGYKTTDDPSVIVRFRVDPADDGTPRSLLAWTTTPWTLPSNVGLAVAPNLEYAEVRLLPAEKHPDAEIVILGGALIKSVIGDRPHEILRRFPGRDLLGTKYQPPLAFATPTDGRAWEVVAADFVTFDTGCGIVHLAPAFGEDDMRAAKATGLGFLQLVEPDGTMSPAVSIVAGQFCKKADPVLIKELKLRGLLFSQGQVRHEYPFCWRADHDPLIQYARQSWFIRTSEHKARMLELNDQIDWHPDNIREGRFGDFLRNNVDWAVSRERFWGTPLPIWVNDISGATDAVCSVPEILQRNPRAFDAFDAARAADPSLSPHLRVHKPWIDQVTWTKPGEAGVYRRVPDVVDCWFDSGAMPFAQRHYPFENQELFQKSFPADYICEAIDQTRGWFYSLLAISTLLFDQPAYKHVIVNGHINDKHGKKMSKSVGNVVDPWDVIGQYGADPLRWYLLGGNLPWLPKSFDPDQIDEISKKVFGTLWPSYNFFALYARMDGWKPGAPAPAPAARPTLDRWLLSRVNSVAAEYRAAFDAFDPHRATRLLADLIDEISNWYIRRNRARFWKSTDAADKAAAYDTLHRALTTLSFLLAPIAPFSADELYVRLHPDGTGLESVFLGTMPDVDRSLIDPALEARMSAVLSVVSLGRSARTTSGLRVRQPLARMVVSAPTAAGLAALNDPSLQDEIRDELNVKELVVVDRRGGYVEVTLKPNLPVLGPRLGKKLGKVKGLLQAPTPEMIQSVDETGSVTLDVDGEMMTFGGNDLIIECTGKPGFAVAAERGYLAALDTALTEDLVLEGLAREVLNRLQNARKDAALEVSDRIIVRASGDGRLAAAITRHEQMLRAEALAVKLTVLDAPPPGSTAIDVDGATLHLHLEKAP